MAIKKQITAPNGIVTEYHRVASVKIDTNQENTILIHSYLSEAGRQIEKDYAAGLYSDVEEGMMNFPYVEAKYINCDYDGEMTIVGAYNYLKTLPDYSGGEDV
jgi:hypothetical protein